MMQEQVSQVLNDPLAQELLHSNIPARLAYIGLDGFPRAIPIGFLWTGTHFVSGTAPKSPVDSSATFDAISVPTVPGTAICAGTFTLKMPIVSAVGPRVIAPAVVTAKPW